MLIWKLGIRTRVPAYKFSFHKVRTLRSKITFPGSLSWSVAQLRSEPKPVRLQSLMFLPTMLSGKLAPNCTRPVLVTAGHATEPRQPEVTRAAFLVEVSFQSTPKISHVLKREAGEGV